MFRFHVVLVIPIVLTCSARAQPFSARHDFAQSSDSDFGVRIFSSDTGYVVVQFGHWNNDVFTRLCLTGVSAFGSTSDIVSFGGDSLGCDAGGANGATINDLGELAICGSTEDGTRVAARVWRFSTAFDSLWSVMLFPDSQDNSLGRMIRCRENANYCVGGVWHGSANGQIFLAKVDTSGNVLWVREYGNILREEGYSLDTTLDGGFILGGQYRGSDTNWQAYVVKTDSLGNEQWHQYLGGPYRDGWANVVSTADSDYVSVGSYATSQTVSTTNKRLFAARLDAEGDIVWQRQYGAASEVTELSSVTELSDGSFISPGLYYDTTVYKGVLLRFAANGDSLWMRTYQHPPLAGTFSVHWLVHVIQDPDGSFVATGSANDGEQDLWVIRVDSFGCLVPGCQQFDNIAEQGLELNVLVYPNPASSRVYISFRSAKPPTGEFVLLNGAGQVVRRFSPGGNSTEIDLDISSHPSGLYLLQYIDQQGMRWESKIIKE